MRLLNIVPLAFSPTPSFLLRAFAAPAQGGNLQYPTGLYSCKPLPGDPDWPAPSTWAAFNSSISGRLLAPLPPAAVCYHSTGAPADPSVCSTVTGRWFESAYHANDPVSVAWPNWEDDACVPPKLYGNSSVPRGCATTQYPRFVVNASSTPHVAAAVKFAGKTGVRLVVKGTGHDMSGR